MKTTGSKIISATEEIFSTIQWSIENFKRDYHVGNFWINDNYNIFAETGVDLDDDNEVEEQYFILKLEQYDKEDNCINCEVDFQDSKDMTKESLYEAIEILLKRNKNISL